MTRAAFLREKLSSKFAHVLPELDEVFGRRDGVHNWNQNASAFGVARNPDQPVSRVLESACGVEVVRQVVAFDDFFFLNSHSHCIFPARFSAVLAKGKSSKDHGHIANEFSPHPTLWRDLSAQVDSRFYDLGTIVCVPSIQSANSALA